MGKRRQKFHFCLIVQTKMNRRDLKRFVDINKLVEKRETDDRFSFFIDDVTEDLKYK